MNGETGGAIRVQLVEDHVMVRAALRMLIERDSRCTVVAETATVREAIETAVRERPDVVILDLDLGQDSGLECLRQIRKIAPTCRVLILTGVRNPEQHQQAVRMGAVGVLSKDKAPESLLKAIDRVHAGETWLDRTTTASLLAELSGVAAPKEPDAVAEKIASLTGREREVIVLVAEGLRNKEIGERLHISEATVRHHLTSIFSKIGVADRMGAIIFAFRHGLASPGQ